MLIPVQLFIMHLVGFALNAVEIQMNNNDLIFIQH